MRRLFILIALAFLALTTVDAQLRLRSIATPVGGAAPDAPSSPYPANAATGVAVTPTLTCTAAGATGFTMYFGTNNPPTNTANGASLGGTCNYVPTTLTVSTVYYWKICAANLNGTTCGSVWSFTTTDGTISFVSHPRLWLTAAKTTELLAKKKANDADYLAMKAYVDIVLSNNPWMDDETTLVGSLNGSATTFAVADGAIFPTTNLYVRIGLELIFCTTRSTNTLSGCTRGADWPGYGTKTDAVAHASGVSVWDHPQSGNPAGVWVNTPYMFALLVMMGDTGYATAARGAMSAVETHLTMYINYYGGPEFNEWDVNLGGDVAYYWNQDYSRWYSPGIAMAYDWLYNTYLTSAEKTLYAESMRKIAWAHLEIGHCNYNCAIMIQQVTLVPSKPIAQQTAAAGNAVAGEIFTALYAAIASYGDNADAGAQYTEAKRQLDSYSMPSISTGPASGGNTQEGMQYFGEAITFIAKCGLAIDTATNTTTYQTTYLRTWLPKVVNFLVHETIPGSDPKRPGDATMTGSMTLGSTTMTVNSATGWSIGMPFRAFASGFESVITNIAGTTLTIRDPSPTTFTNGLIINVGRWLPWGDVNQGEEERFDSAPHGDDHVIIAMMVVDLLKATNPTVAGYARYWIVNHANPPIGAEYYIQKVIFDDTSVSAVNYTALPTVWSSATASANTCGLGFGRTGWGLDQTIVQYLSGCEQWSHVHSHYGSYQILDHGVYLSREIPGYGVDPFPGKWALDLNPSCTDGCDLTGEGVYMGARYHNSVLMNGHSGNNTFILSQDLVNSANTPRADANASDGYLYMRTDASGAFDSTYWSTIGYTSPNANDSQTFVRDFIYIPASNILAFSDRLGYRNASVSPTMWIAQFTGNPSMVGQRISSTFAGRAMTHDIVYPTGASFTEIDEVAEVPALATYFTRTHYRIETTSGATTANEYSLQVIQVGASGFTPLSVTGLTTTNAQVAQVGTLVIGGVKAATPTLSITYDVTGTPVHYLMGFAVSTAYHVTRASNTITIAAATGSGDTTSTAAGVLKFTL